MAEASVLRGINAYPREAGIVFESPAVMGDDSMISGTNRGPDGFSPDPSKHLRADSRCSPNSAVIFRFPET
jgi:hypothetical protein